jgi:hypothetical protein
MWPYIIGFIVIVGILVVVMNRRGSTGAGRAYDEPSRVRGNDRAADPYGGSLGGGGWGGDGGGGGF